MRILKRKESDFQIKWTVISNSSCACYSVDKHTARKIGTLTKFLTIPSQAPRCVLVSQANGIDLRSKSKFYILIHVFAVILLKY